MKRIEDLMVELDGADPETVNRMARQEGSFPVCGSGYRAFPDAGNIDEDADSYFLIPGFITSLQDRTFYILLLTGLSADMLTACKGKTTWIYDEYQHAAKLADSGRLVIVPVLLEPEGMIDAFTPGQVIDIIWICNKK